MTQETQTPSTPLQKKSRTVVDLISSEKFKSSIHATLPKHMDSERMARIALTELRKNPKLMECDPLSFAGAVMQCSQLGLEPGNNLGHAYLIPYQNRKMNTVECQFMIGYRGMIDLARRSGQVKTLQAHVMREGDVFEFEYGLNPKLRHIPNPTSNGRIMYVYACASLKDDCHQFEVLSVAEVNEIKKSSKSSNNSPWETHYEEMAKKTAIRRLFKYLPVSIEMSQAVSLDEAADMGHQNNAILAQSLLGNEEEEDLILSSTKSDRMAEMLSNAGN